MLYSKPFPLLLLTNNRSQHSPRISNIRCKQHLISNKQQYQSTPTILQINVRLNHSPLQFSNQRFQISYWVRNSLFLLLFIMMQNKLFTIPGHIMPELPMSIAQPNQYTKFAFIIKAGILTDFITSAHRVLPRNCTPGNFICDVIQLECLMEVDYWLGEDHFGGGDPGSCATYYNFRAKVVFKFVWLTVRDFESFYATDSTSHDYSL